MTKKHYYTTGIAVFIALLAADIMSKQWVVMNTGRLIARPIEVIPGLFNITSLRNTGAAWGMFHNNNIILLLVAIAAFALILVFIKSITEGYTERIIAVFMILSGIAGNSIDRIIRQSVVDFLDFFFYSYHWPAFNIADSAICTGAAIIILSTIIRQKKTAAGNETAGK